LIKERKTVSWILKNFEELTNKELHDIYQLRVNIFIVEQNCPYPEIDGKDVNSLHLFKTEGEVIVAYSRLLPPGLSYEQPSIGRVIVNEKFRGQGLGNELMSSAIKIVKEKWSGASIKIQAQSYLQSFYESLGFVQVTDEYLEDNIPHIDMLL